MKRYNTLLSVCMLLCLVAATTPSHAQRGKGMDKMRQRVEDLRKVKLIDLLDLQGAQVEKFFGTYNRLQQNVIVAKEGMDDAARALQESATATASETDMNSKSDALLAKMKEFERAINARHNEVRPLLSPLQYARYLAFEARFQEELQRMILQRARKRGMGVD